MYSCFLYLHFFSLDIVPTRSPAAQPEPFVGCFFFKMFNWGVSVNFNFGSGPAKLPAH